MLKKALALLLSALLLCLSGCASAPREKRLTVVASLFPEYDWVRQILGDDSRIDLILLCDDGVDPHSFQPTVRDIVSVCHCDLLIFGGGESDEWLKDVLRGDVNPDMLVLELLPLLGDRTHTTQTIPGMQTREAEEETDEHIWLSLRNAKLFCGEITEALCQLDEAKAETYRENYRSYAQKLDALDQRYIQTLQQADKDTILVCDRFPFRYLTEDYSIRYYAAFPGCSAESGASFQTIVFLTDMVQKLELNAVLTLEGSDRRLAKTVADNSRRETVSVLTLDSMQSVSLRDAAERDYLKTMEQNRLVLEAALA